MDLLKELVTITYLLLKRNNLEVSHCIGCNTLSSRQQELQKKQYKQKLSNQDLRFFYNTLFICLFICLFVCLFVGERDRNLTCSGLVFQSLQHLGLLNSGDQILFCILHMHGNDTVLRAPLLLPGMHISRNLKSVKDLEFEHKCCHMGCAVS